MKCLAAGMVFLSSLIVTGALHSDTTSAQTRPRDAVPAKGKPLAIGFYVDWDEKSYASLAQNIENLDWVVASWLYLRGEAMDLTQARDLKGLELIRSQKPKMSILAMIQNVSAGVWDGINLARFLANPGMRHERIGSIAEFIEHNHFQGTVIDFEQIPDNAHKNMLAFLNEVHAAFQARGWLVAVAVPFADPKWDYRAYAKASDYLILMAYDEHWPGGSPGPIASQAWFASRVAGKMQQLDPARTFVAIGNYGYDWTIGDGSTEALTFQDAMRRARNANAAIEFDRLTLNPHFSYDHEGKRHQVWFLNAATAYHQMRAADRYRPAGYAIWRLGAEDPSVWSVLPRTYDAPPPASLSMISPGNEVTSNGSGE